VKYLLVSLGCLEVIDGLFTRWAVTAGVARESNPLLTSVAGDWDFVFLKVIGAVVSALMLAAVYRRFPRAAAAAGAGVASFYGLVLVWNLGAFLRL
jgi:hypothetical protein